MCEEPNLQVKVANEEKLLSKGGVKIPMLRFEAAILELLQITPNCFHLYSSPHLHFLFDLTHWENGLRTD